MDSDAVNNVPAVIIAGGQSRRMGGVEKCLLRLGDSSVLEVLIDRLRKQAEHIAINSNGDPQWFAGFGLPVIPDSQFLHAGPLAGIATAIDWAQRHHPSATCCLTVPADTPFIPRTLKSQLISAAHRQQVDIIYASHGPQHHYLTGLWSTSIFTALIEFLENGGRATRDFLAGQKTGSLVFNSVDHGHNPFFNINTPEDLEIAQAIMTTGNK